MGCEPRWDPPCIAHRATANEVDGFLAHYFGQPDRNVLLVAGAGFDPRACAVAARLGETATSVHALLIKEERPNPPQDQMREEIGPRLSPQTRRRFLLRWPLGKWSRSTYSGRRRCGRRWTQHHQRPRSDCVCRQSLGGVTDVVIHGGHQRAVGRNKLSDHPHMVYFVERIVRGKESSVGWPD